MRSFLFSFYAWLLLICVSSLFCTIPAGAQQTWTRKAHNYAGGELSSLPDGNSLIHQLTPIPDQELSMLRHVALDSMLRQRHQATLIIPGYDVRLVGHALNKQAALYRFRRFHNDTAFTAVVDTVGRILSFRRERRNQRVPDLVMPLPLPSDSLFLLCSQPSNERSFELECLTVQQKVRWKLPFTATDGKLRLLGFWADERYAWLVTGDNAASRLTEHWAWCLELRTGQVVSHTLLDLAGTRRFVAETLLRPDHSLVLAGRTFDAEDGQRISRIKSGNLFLTQLQPNGSRTLDYINPIQDLQGLNVLTTDQVYWQQLGTDPQGNFFLIGETFVSTSAANSIAQQAATGLLTMGLVRADFASLTPRELVRVRFDAQGKIITTTLVPLPVARTLGGLGYAPAQTLAAAAEASGMFRLRATSTDGNIVLLRNKNDLSLLNITTQQQRIVHTNRELKNLDVWGARHNAALLYPTQVDKGTEQRLERIPLR
jgi:hypothetical protein